MSKKKALPGKRRQRLAVVVASKELAIVRPEIAKDLCVGPGRQFTEKDRCHALLKRRALVESAADALVELNPGAALCLYAEAIGLFAKGRRSKVLESLRQKASIARRRAGEMKARRRNLRSKELNARQQEKAAQKSKAMSAAENLGGAQACVESRSETEDDASRASIQSVGVKRINQMVGGKS